MIEVYKDSSEYLFLSTANDDSMESPEGDVVVSLKDVKTGLVLVTATAEEPSPGNYRYRIPQSFTSYDRTIAVLWTYSINGAPFVKRDVLEVVTPYVSVEEIYNAYPQLADKSQDEVKEMERQVRTIINSYTGQYFGLLQDTITVNYWPGSSLNIGKRVVAITNVEMHPRPTEFINPTTFFRVDGYGALWFDVKADVYKIRNRGAVQYKITGLFGWEYVPNDINVAALMLIKDYYCSDNEWRQKGIQAVTAGDWRLDYSALAHAGTGNLDVDRILNAYRSTTMVII